MTPESLRVSKSSQPFGALLPEDAATLALHCPQPPFTLVATTAALATTGNALVGLLEEARPQALFPNLHIRLYQTVELQSPKQALNEVVSVCPYRVSHNQSRRNLPPKIDPVTQIRHRPPVALDIHFLLTAWAQDATQQARILGWMIRTLEDSPTLQAGFLNRFAGATTQVFAPDEAIDLVADAVTQQDLYTIWQVAPSRQQPSLVYVARMILLDSDISMNQGVAVQTRVFDGKRLASP